MDRRIVWGAIIAIWILNISAVIAGFFSKIAYWVLFGMGLAIFAVTLVALLIKLARLRKAEKEIVKALLKFMIEYEKNFKIKPQNTCENNQDMLK